MNKSESEYNPALYKVKAILLKDNKTVVEGYLVEWENKHRSSDTMICVNEYEAECDELIPIHYPVNSHTVCRNTGILVGNNYLYEYDLVEKELLGSKGLYYVEWDKFQKGYILKGSLNFNGVSKLNGNITIVGNIMLIDEDFYKMQQYSEDKEVAYSGPEPTVECRSKQHLNKRAKEFLPRY